MATINGTINDDTLKGGADNDIITGGLGNDLAWMGGGNDVFIWNAGHGNDTVEGQAGFDTLRFFADSKTEIIDVSANGTRTKIHWDILDSTLDLNDVERIDIRAREGLDTVYVHDLTGTDVKQVAIDLAGAVSGTDDGVQDNVGAFGTDSNDTIVASGGSKVTVTGLAAQMTISNAGTVYEDWLELYSGKGNDVIDGSKLDLMSLYAEGGKGNDRITGGAVEDQLHGDEGNDIIVGGAGNDEAELGAGDDLFAWFVGDGSDFVDGGSGIDTARLTGSNASEVFSVSTNPGSTLASRNGAASLTTDSVERLQIRALGGADRIDILDLTGSNVRQVAVDLAAKAGGALADASVDTVQVFGTSNDDVIEIGWSGSSVTVTGLAAKIDIAHAGATDVLRVYGDVGNDMIVAAGLPAGKMRLQLFGGSGDDVIMGSAGNDIVTGGVGNDRAFLGAGNDQFVWNVGDGSDKVEGQTGIDTLVVKGSAGAEEFFINNFDQGEFSIGLETVALNDVERVQLSTGGGQDIVNVFENTLANTGLKQVAIDLGLAGGAGDSQEDSIFVHGTTGNDQVTIVMAGGVVSIDGLHAQVTITHAETQDFLSIWSDSGDDVINASSLAAGTMTLDLYGGSGNDTITGSAGSDLLIGAIGNDVLRGGGGADTLTGGDGDDVVVGGRGDDAITGGAGSDAFRYTSVLDGHDVISDFDGDAAGGQDTFNLDALFDALGIANGARAGRVDITDNGGTVDIFVNADGNAGNGFELHVATLTTLDQITIGQDVILS